MEFVKHFVRMVCIYCLSSKKQIKNEEKNLFELLNAHLWVSAIWNIYIIFGVICRNIWLVIYENV